MRRFRRHAYGLTGLMVACAMMWWMGCGKDDPVSPSAGMIQVMIPEQSIPDSVESIVVTVTCTEGSLWREEFETTGESVVIEIPSEEIAGENRELIVDGKLYDGSISHRGRKDSLDIEKETSRPVEITMKSTAIKWVRLYRDDPKNVIRWGRPSADADSFEVRRVGGDLVGTVAGDSSRIEDLSGAEDDVYMVTGIYAIPNSDIVERGLDLESARGNEIFGLPESVEIGDSLHPWMSSTIDTASFELVYSSERGDGARKELDRDPVDGLYRSAEGVKVNPFDVGITNYDNDDRLAVFHGDWIRVVIEGADGTEEKSTVAFAPNDTAIIGFYESTDGVSFTPIDEYVVGLNGPLAVWVKDEVLDPYDDDVDTLYATLSTTQAEDEMTVRCIQRGPQGNRSDSAYIAWPIEVVAHPALNNPGNLLIDPEGDIMEAKYVEEDYDNIPAPPEHEESVESSISAYEATEWIRFVSCGGGDPLDEINPYGNVCVMAKLETGADASIDADVGIVGVSGNVGVTLTHQGEGLYVSTEPLDIAISDGDDRIEGSTFYVNNGSTMWARYGDLPEVGAMVVIRTAGEIWWEGEGEIVADSVRMGLDTVWVVVEDEDMNRDRDVRDTVSVVLTPESEGDWEELHLTETGLSSGVFRSDPLVLGFDWNPDQNDAQFDLRGPADVYASYEDADRPGGDTTIVATISAYSGLTDIDVRIMDEGGAERDTVTADSVFVVRAQYLADGELYAEYLEPDEPTVEGPDVSWSSIEYEGGEWKGEAICEEEGEVIVTFRANYGEAPDASDSVIVAKLMLNGVSDQHWGMVHWASENDTVQYWTNGSQYRLLINSVGVDGGGGQFTIYSGDITFPHYLEPDDTLAATLRFAPRDTLSHTGTLRVATNRGEVTSDLTGRGASGILASLPDSLLFGEHADVDTVTVKNTGRWALLVKAWIDQEPGESFELHDAQGILQDTLEVSVPQDGSYHMIVRFEAPEPPPCGRGLVEGTLMVHTDQYPAWAQEDSVELIGYFNWPPNPPTNIAPENGSTVRNLTPMFQWSCVDPDNDDLRYTLTLWPDGGGEVEIEAGEGESGETVTYTISSESPLAPHTKYYWYIEAADNISGETPGGTWYFWTPNLAPNEPTYHVPPSPPDGETNWTLTPTFAWDCVDADGDDLTYTLWLSGDGDTRNIDAGTWPSGQTASYTIPDTDPLLGHTEYTWHITAEDTEGAETTGSDWRFTTLNQAPNSPSDPHPGPGQTDVELTPTFSWSCSDPDWDQLWYYVQGAIQGGEYQHWYSGPDNSFPFDGQLQGDTWYDWQVQANDDYEGETWGLIWSFKTEAEGTSVQMIYIPGGTFQMGSDSDWAQSDEQPVHSVTLSSFSMAQYEVTNEQMRQVLQWAYDNGKVSATSSTVTNSEGDQQELLDLDYAEIGFSGGTFTVESGKEDHPCIEVTWYGAQAFCNYLSDMEGLERSISFSDWSCTWSANGYRLLTEAEWEYACRAGTTTDYYSGDETASKCDYDPNLDLIGWYCYNASSTQTVGQKQANDWQLYDMSGNVCEWCWDWYQYEYYGESPSQDPTGPPSGSRRVIRGGDWRSFAEHCRSASRNWTYPYNSYDCLGFRPARR